jgi:hypothetical protein
VEGDDAMMTQTIEEQEGLLCPHCGAAVRLVQRFKALADPPVHTFLRCSQCRMAFFSVSDLQVDRVPISEYDEEEELVAVHD